MAETEIVVRGAREHNLRDVNLTIPRNQLVVMTGVSGSGKSSLAFDTLYAEGQRRYVESLSSYARQFLGQLPKPDVDAISGLSPSISIQQKSTGRNPRSTVGTITEIYDYLRVLYARVGQGYCYNCDRPITAQTPEQIAENIAQLPEGTRLQILAPLIQQQKGEYRDLFEDLLKQGYLRARVNGNVVNLTDDLQLDRQMRHTIEVVVDRLKLGTKQRSRLAEAVENALKLSGGSLIAAVEPATDARAGKNRKAAPADRLYSSHYACTTCGISYEPPSPQLFSFNSPLGMCLECNGLGMRHDFDHARLIPNDKLSLSRGAIDLVGSIRKIGRWRRHIYRGVAAVLERDHGLPEDSLLKMPWRDIPPAVQEQLLYGTGDRNITFAWRHSGGVWKHGGTWEGFIPELLESYRKTSNPMRRRQLEKYMEIVVCPACRGARLNRQACSVKIATASKAFRGRGGATELSLAEVCGLSIAAAGEFFEKLDLDDARQYIATEVLKEIRGRLGFLLHCGLDYLTLDRTAPTLSGGESQRIRLAGQIGSGLVGVLYILDEPSIGLHPRDNTQLLNSLLHLRDQGNTVVVVEHDEETMRAADHIVDFGPGPGVRGGEIVAEGTLTQVKKSKRSLTGQFISGRRKIEVPSERRKPRREKLKIVAAAHNNLKNVDVSIPLGTFVCVTGVSGSGKSSLVNDILWQALNRDVNQGKGKPGRHRRINGLQHVDKAIDIDQSPIGRTPRSNPATYVKLFDQIRDLFTKLPESKVRGYKPGRFSFNVPSGRCEACEGYGSNKLEMDFLADVWVTCPVCEGRRFNRETLEVRYKGANIAEVLDMDVQQALEHFENIPKIASLLQTLHDVGLDYLKLGQPSPTLSGGEAQRIKLARELGKRSTGRTIYLLDEPTTGLHFADVEKLLEVLHGFVNAGNTVLVVEHNLDVVKTADWIVDLGPEGGEGGGEIVVEGPPEKIAACKNSHTGRALDEILNPRPARRRSATKKTRKASRNGQERHIVVNGAAQHNLQSVDLQVPRNRMSVFSGPSGSGKTSLAMDTLYAEGQRRYVESLSAYARQFLGQMPKPKIEHLSGLPPAIAIEQRATGHTPRSTVGTVTEIYDYLRILYARLGQPYCPDCDIPVATQTTDEVVEKILNYEAKSKILLLAPQEVRVGESWERLWERLQGQGFLRVRVDGTTYRLDNVPELDRRRKLNVEIVVDRLTVNRRTRSRIADSVESALELGHGTIRVAVCDDDRPETEWRVDRYSLHSACENCGLSFEQLTPHNFSFNSSLGWCEACEGLGTQQGTNLAALVADPKRTLADGAIAAWPSVKRNPQFRRILAALGREFGLPDDVPFQELAPHHQRLVLYGSGERWISLDDENGVKIQYKGLYPAVEEATRVSFVYRQRLRDMVGETHCSVCHGSRLRPDSAAVRLRDKTLQQVCDMPLSDSLQFFESMKLNRTEKRIAGDLLREVQGRLSFLVDVGLHYLSLSRPMPTLSGGETQRIRLAGQVGRALTGVLYVLDEPTIGLHPRDNGRLLSALKKLRDLNNTLILVEHDREVIAAADRLYDFGPGAGRLGGTVVGQGTPKQLSARKTSLTGQYLSGREEIPIPETRRMQDGPDAPPPPGGGWLEIRGARHHNLRDVDLRIPLGTLTCVTGVSGSGKSSLIEDTLAVALARKLHHGSAIPGAHDGIDGIDMINKVITVDQQPLGSTPKSNPATYTGVFDQIRELYSRLPDAKVRGYRPGRFSFNRAGGRCEACEGNGEICIEMHFLPDVWVRCDECGGRRFNEETLAVKYRGKSIADVLEMPIGEAAQLFDNIPKIRRYLATLSAIGLDYLTLGQSAPTLSGGEAQRVKLAAELARPQTGKTLYILDEPTTGLHFDDIRKLMRVLDSLVEAGNTIVVIEHNLDVIKTADWVIDMGPEAGSEGGEIVTEGTPEAIVAYAKAAAKPKSKRPRSFTGELLAPVLEAGTRREREVFNARAAAKKREGDVDIAQVGRGAEMPWKKDGRRWHTRDRISHSGNPCRWEGAALELVVDALEDREGLKAVNWNSRGTVEIAGPKGGHGWFFHALTGDEWLLTLTFRVPKNTFDQDELRGQLSLDSLDDLDELPVYGRGERVRVKNLKGPWQEVKITVHWLREIDTPEFREFLDTAADAYAGKVTAAGTKVEDLAPWKVLGKKWHLSRKGFPSGKRVKWATEVLDELATLLEKSLPQAEVDWRNKQVVYFKPAGSDTVRASVHTKRRGGIDLSLYVDKGRFALGKIADLGRQREIAPHRNGQELIKIRFDSADQVAQPALKEILKEIAHAIK